MSSGPDSFPDISGSFAAVSAQMRQRKLDAVAEMRRIVQEHTGTTMTHEEFAKLLLSSRDAPQHHTHDEVIADLRNLAEDYRCHGSADLAAKFNELADLAETFNN
ncbi:hypothetical protein ABH920_005703 [Catenulispora sp. EB89]|uniref:hypothetical protein n=1 Tax=Catenulispora sp. EB89 TaxID=3156257 RepID=UPI00351577B1